MSFENLTIPFPWSRYSKKLAFKIDRPHNVGIFNQKESEARGMRLVVGSEGSVEDGNCVALFWLVDKEDGVVVDACFQVFGQSALIGAAEISCDLVVGKNYDQARRIGAELIDKFARDHSSEPAFPKETAPHLNLVLEAIDKASSQCKDLPLAQSYVAPPVPMDFGTVVEGGYPGWLDLTKVQKMAIIEEVINSDILPYIALDGGGVTLVDLNQNQVQIAYEGNCTSCYSSVGATLSYIQHVIRSKVHPDLEVVPN